MIEYPFRKFWKSARMTGNHTIQSEMLRQVNSRNFKRREKFPLPYAYRTTQSQSVAITVPLRLHRYHFLVEEPRNMCLLFL